MMITVVIADRECVAQPYYIQWLQVEPEVDKIGIAGMYAVTFIM